MAKEPWEIAIKNLKLLMKERSGADWWSSNIIDSSAHLHEKRDWALFYAYLANPKTFDPTVVPITLDDLIVIPPDPVCPPTITETWHRNGTVTTILVKPVESNEIEDDEKTPPE